jgi:hypothetical protein
VNPLCRALFVKDHPFAIGASESVSVTDACGAAALSAGGFGQDEFTRSVLILYRSVAVAVGPFCRSMGKERCRVLADCLGGDEVLSSGWVNVILGMWGCIIDLMTRSKEGPAPAPRGNSNN